MATKPKQNPAETNGQPELYDLKGLYPVELELLHRLLVNAPFQSVQDKQVAASAQAKIEQVAQKMQEAPAG